MKETNTLTPGGIYLFKSHSCGNTCFFESQEEINLFKRLLKIHLQKYIRVHNIVLQMDGYQMLVKIKDCRTLKSNYKNELHRVGKIMNVQYENEPWRIISEKMRIVHSIYAKTVNKLRDRTGVLVKSRYKRYYFESIQEAITYIENTGFKVERSQSNSKYEANPNHTYIYNWALYKTRNWLQGMDFFNLDLLTLSRCFSTRTLHNSYT